MANDEQDLGTFGVPPDPGYAGYKHTQGPTVDDTRKYALWATIMAGGAGVEYYFGYVHPQNDLLCEDWRSRDLSWDYARFALEFFADHRIPFWEMRNANELAGNPAHDNTRYCLAKDGEIYLVYLPDGAAAQLDLSGVSGSFGVRWLNPRAGGALRDGSAKSVRGGGRATLGNPPADPGEDWLVIVRK